MLKKNKKYRMLLLALLVLALPFSVISVSRQVNFFGIASAKTAVLSLTPENQELSPAQVSKSVVSIAPNGAEVSGVEFVLSYDPDIVDITAITPGSFFTDHSSSVGDPLVIKESIADGLLHYAIAFPLGSRYSSSSTGVVATLSIVGKAAGVSNIEFKLSDAKLNTIVANVSAENVLESVNDAKVTTLGDSNVSEQRTYKVLSSADDADSYGTTHNYSRYYVNLPSWSNGYFRFKVDIPKQSIIAKSALRLRTDSSISGSATADLGMIDSDNCSDFTQNPYNLTTIGQTSWALSSTPGNTWVESSDISSFVQSFVNRPGYSPGNHLCIVWTPRPNSADVSIWSQDGGYPAELNVDFASSTQATPTPTNIPTNAPTATLTPTSTPTPTPTSTPEVTEKVSYEVSNFADDADSYGTTHNYSRYYINLPSWSRGYFRFPISLPAGSTITGAQLSVRTDSSIKGKAIARLSLIDSSDCSDFTQNPYSLPTTGETSWTLTNTSGNTWVTSSDISSLVQSFVDKGGYRPGNHMCIVWMPVSNSKDVSIWAKDGGYAPRLNMEYTK